MDVCVGLMKGPVIKAARVAALSGLLGALWAPASAQGFTSDQVAAGKAVYDRTCVRCHGRNMVNSGTTVYDLRRFPQDDKQRYMDSVNNGKGNMPSWKGRLTPDEIEATWAYVATRGGKDM